MSEGEQTVREYLTKLGQHDLPGCLEYFADDSVLEVRSGPQRGKEAIGAWHADRFAANLAVISVDSVTQKGSEATADFLMTSDRLAGKRMEEIPMRLLINMSDGKFSRMQLKVRLGAGLKGLLGMN